jgi:hypothetical protein
MGSRATIISHTPPLACFILVASDRPDLPEMDPDGLMLGGTIRQGLRYRNLSSRGKVPEFSVGFRGVWSLSLGFRPGYIPSGPMLGSVFLWRCCCRQKPPCTGVCAKQSSPEGHRCHQASKNFYGLMASTTPSPMNS